MGGAYERVHSFGGETFRKETTQEDLELGERLIPRRISLLYRAILNIILNIQLIAQCFIIKIH